MPFTIVRNDITKMECDAIVNAARHSLLGGGGVDGAVHRAAGPRLLAECRALGGCDTGEAKITRGYDLPAKYVIHTVGPVYQDGHRGEPRLLRACYINSLRLAAQHDCHSIAFPLISAGAYGYPLEEALRIATEAISDYLAEVEDEPEVYLVLYGSKVMQLVRKRYDDIREYIDDNYAAPDEAQEFRRKAANLLFDLRHESKRIEREYEDYVEEAALSASTAAQKPAPALAGAAAPASLTEALAGMRDESFSEMLLRLIDERGMTDAQCYKKANIDRKLFSKIRSDRLYHPKKATALAFAVALELSLEETRELLAKAGLALSHSYRFDVIIEYFILKGQYNVFEINEALFAFDQPLLGQ